MTPLRALIVTMGLLAASSLGASAATSRASGLDRAVGSAPLAATPWSSDISANTEWTAANSPYLVTSSITVHSGSTLTVDPGVVVEFAGDTGLTIDGTLKAVGTAASPIQFVPATAGKVNFWNGLFLVGTPAAPNNGSVLSYVTIAGGGRNTGSDLVLDHAHVAIDHATFADSGTEGIRGLQGGFADVSTATFTNNGGAALWFRDPTYDPMLSSLRATGNGTNAIVLDAYYASTPSIAGAQEWEAAGLPYQINGSLTFATGSHLTVDPGVTVQFAQYTGLTLGGPLTAIGTATAPISFVPLPTAPPPQVDWWNGLGFLGTAAAPNTGSVLRYVTVAGGGQDAGADIVLNETHVAIDHSTFKDSGVEAIRGLSGGYADIRDSTFSNNAGAAIWLRDPTPDSTLSNLTASGNGDNAIVLDASDAPAIPIVGSHEWTAAGMPYEIAGTLDFGGQLIVDPGVTVQFRPGTWLTMGGRLVAEGSADQPIVFQGIAAHPQEWGGISLHGQAGAPNDGSSLSYVTISGANGSAGAGDLNLTFASAKVSHSVLTNSRGDGVHVVDGATSSVIQASQITGNSGFGIRNDVPDKLHVLAAANWWGDPSGPSSAPPPAPCAPTGSGDEITTGVDYQPFLTSASGAPTGPVATNIDQVTITPAAWFSPPDGVTRDYLTITVRDGAGHPLANQRVHVTTDLGTAVDGGVTGPTGQTNAYLTSDTAGDAHVTVHYQPDSSRPCAEATTPSTTITFQPVDDGGGLVEKAPAPYASEDILVPSVAMRGVTVNVGARIRNPSATNPLSVTMVAQYAQSGIGLVFGPVGQTTQVIPPGGQADVTVPWTPLVAGHFCFQVHVVARETATSSLAAQALKQYEWQGQRNVDVQPAALAPREQKDLIQKAALQSDRIEDASFVVGALTSPEGIPTGLVQSSLFDNILSFIHEAGGAVSCGMRGGANCGGWSGPHFGIGTGLPGGSLVDDPPRSDYKIIATLDHLSYPTVSTANQIPAARAQALNDLMAASVDLTVKLRAAVLSYDRYAGAAAASDVSWASQQTAAYLYYKQQAGLAMIATADKLDALQQELKGEGFTDLVVAPTALVAYQQRLQSQGFSTDELTAARDLGYTDDIIEGIRQNILAEDPSVKSGGQFALWTDYAAALRAAGLAISAPPPTFSDYAHASSAALRAQATSDNLVQSYANATTVQVGNPLSQTATIDLHARRLDLPADWMVSVSPSSVTLAPGGQATVAVTVQPGLSGVQDTEPRVAVEGYANGQLLGGVVVGVALPQWRFFDGRLRVYLPAVFEVATAGR